MNAMLQLKTQIITKAKGVKDSFGSSDMLFDSCCCIACCVLMGGTVFLLL